MLPNHCFVTLLLCTLSVSSATRLVKYNEIQEITTEEFSIVGGEDVDIKEVPYQVALLIDGRLHCGASLIAANIILTAAHCAKPPVKVLSIRAGSSKLEEGGTVVKVSQKKSHPKYVRKTLEYDVAVMWLEKELKFGPTITSVKLAKTGDELNPGTNVLVTGWGSIREAEPGTDSLQKVTVPIISNKSCIDDYNDYDKNITENMLCAGFPQGGKDACQGDSGGPLVHAGVQYGIVSWGDGCARPGRPGVYANVAVLRSWIDETIEGGK